ncbi:MAG: hypothetical protein RIS70_2062 [Planctomycetota bacterium]|jgi:thioredoxin-like negative regulator of GroEL
MKLQPTAFGLLFFAAVSSTGLHPHVALSPLVGVVAGADQTSADVAKATGNSQPAAAAKPATSAKPVSSGNYAEGYRQMQETGRPLLVLVGADWCPGCRTMKNATLPALEKAGQLDDVIPTVVNCDRESDLADQLMRGGTIPQLILFTRTKDGWRRTQLTGAYGAADVRKFLNREVAQHQAAPAGEGAE